MSPPSAKINGAYVQGLIIATVAGSFAWNFVRLLEKIMGEPGRGYGGWRYC